MPTDGSKLSLVFGRDLGSVVIDIQGALDATTAGQLRDRLGDLIAGQGNRNLVLDLSGMTLIDADGLAVLVDAHTQLASRSGTLLLSGAARDVVRAFEAAGVHTLFTLTPSWAHPAHGLRLDP